MAKAFFFLSIGEENVANCQDHQKPPLSVGSRVEGLVERKGKIEEAMLGIVRIMLL